MIVRQIRPEEYKRVQEFCALAFEYSFHTDKSPIEFWESETKEPSSRQAAHWQSQWAAFQDDDQTMMSTFTVIPYTVRFDHGFAPMMGIGGVSTLPQYRKHGGIRACFEKALPQMYRDGAVFSYLYPFSTLYYRKFGYELGCDRVKWTVTLNALPRFDAPGQCSLLEKGCDFTVAVTAVDQAWAKRYNMAVQPEAFECRWATQADPFKDKEYSYLYHSPDGTPMGYVSFGMKPGSAERDLQCSRFVFTCAEGFMGLMNLLASLQADHARASFFLPTDMDLSAFYPEWSFGAVERGLEFFGMVRVINVEAALKMAAMRGEGKLSIALTDSQISQNNGCFTVSFKPGAENQVSKTNDTPDILMSIQAFSRMLLGRCDLDAAPGLPDVTLQCDIEKAARVFYRKPLYIHTYF
ncbi:MAG: GNAT family N-acetyltransferase [Eubacteriales bacterium]|nr:GNAT family N-acetyltransferase [Eubacteriales bacterium]